LDHETNRSQRHGDSLSLAMIDIDGFKKIQVNVSESASILVVGDDARNVKLIEALLRS